ncbi:alpha/beta fold hydrolase [Actinomadura sp. LD22]|uniref:Alpha/beta fold hydrolase n=1 Tax=Actinomadura physcomitrii TaxID=2650748 RepID=A0A6I4MJG5_9ACTN|nr:alpha/beta fold hydrolase [Actinomadura physcomitrii]MWA03052.1 alpha/beta fold hydrolase [Actinomadura physcomitrii]
MVRPLDHSFDVTEEIGTGEPLSQTAWIFAPEDAAEVKGAILCLAGGTYDKKYWHLEVPGHEGYSFARRLARRGYVVIALDHLGVGGSADPTASGGVDLQLLASGDAAVAAQVRARLDDGMLVPGLRPLPHLPLIGAGHSMGACLTTMVQARAGAYDAVALLGYGVDITTFTMRRSRPTSLRNVSRRARPSSARARERPWTRSRRSCHESRCGRCSTAPTCLRRSSAPMTRRNRGCPSEPPPRSRRRATSAGTPKRSTCRSSSGSGRSTSRPTRTRSPPAIAPPLT